MRMNTTTTRLASVRELGQERSVHVVLARKGRFSEAATVRRWRLDARADLSQFHVFRDDQRTYVATSSPLPPDSPLLIQVTIGGRKNPLVNGTIYAIDNQSNKLVRSPGGRADLAVETGTAGASRPNIRAGPTVVSRTTASRHRGTDWAAGP